MGKGLLFDCDESVAGHLFATYKWPAFKFDRCVGIIDADRQLVGAVFLHYWNGTNLELSYYGESTLSSGLVRTLARFIVCTFGPSRLTVVVSKRRKRLMRSLQRFGFKLEGHQRCYYGKHDCSRNTGVRFVMFRERIDQLAKIVISQRVESAC